MSFILKNELKYREIKRKMGNFIFLYGVIWNEFYINILKICEKMELQCEDMVCFGILYELMVQFGTFNVINWIFCMCKLELEYFENIFLKIFFQLRYGDFWNDFIKEMSILGMHNRSYA